MSPLSISSYTHLIIAPTTRYFGGSLDLFSLDGWGEYCAYHGIAGSQKDASGSDVYLKLRCLDEAGDAQI